MGFVASVLILASAFLLVAGAERIPALRFREGPLLRPYLATDVAWYGVAMTAAAISAVVFRPQLERLQIAPIAARFSELPWLGRFLVAIVVYDLVAFLVHVGIHRSDRLWHVHKVHHSSLRLDWLATTRTHMMEHLLRNVPAQLALFAIGAPGSLVALTLLTYASFALIGHSNLDLPLRRLEWLFITPRLHRLHHVPATTQNNFGTIFSVWDRAFGLLVRADIKPHEPMGVPGEITTYPQRFVPSFRAPFLAIRGAIQETTVSGISSER